MFISSRSVAIIVCGVLVLSGFVPTAHASPHRASGNILSLSATDAPDYGDTVNASSTVQATSKVQTSNLYYEITIGATLVHTQTTNPPSMQIGDTFNDSWSVSNSGFPSIGTYTLTLCWSTGGSTNCDIASASTTFYSVPTLGWGLMVAGGGLLTYWLWTRKAEFRESRI